MKYEIKIEDGLVKLYNGNDLVASEQSHDSKNIYTYEEFDKLHERVKTAHYENMRKAGRTEQEIKSSVQVLVFAPMRTGQYLAVTKKDVIPALLKLKEERQKIEAAEKEESENEITIYISSRGWGDYSPLEWTGDRRLPVEKIVEEMRELINNGHDVDENPSDEELAKLVKKAKGEKLEAAQKELDHLNQKDAGIDPADLPTAAEAAKIMRRYNDIHNEGGEGYVPHVQSREEYDARQQRRNELQKIIAAERGLN